MGNRAMSSAASGGAAMFIAPCSIWLRPATRDRCTLGTMSDVEACIAGQWRLLPSARMNMTT